MHNDDDTDLDDDDIDLEPDPQHRIALVIDITGLRRIDTQHATRASLQHAVNYLTNRHIEARPVRIDINGYTDYIADLGR